MGRMRRNVLGSVFGALLAAVPLAGGSALPTPGPLRPGEGLVLCTGEGAPQAFGEVSKPSSLGGLACLPWLKLLGPEWGSEDVRFQCAGGAEPFPCGGPKGHGKVDLGAALRRGCDRALLAWASASLAQWHDQLGGAVARLQLLEAFGPFLGDRAPAGQGLPVLTPAWVGRGDLLQASPAALAAWLQDPDQLDVVTALQRYGRGSFAELKVLAGLEGWWILPAAATADGSSGRWTWVLAGRGDLLAVLRIPEGRSQADGVARLKAILGLK